MDTSTAVSESGQRYAAGRVASQTHLLDIPSELAALVRATHANDYRITEVSTLTEKFTSPPPIVLKILIDHSARTGVPIRYTISDASGLRFEISDVHQALPTYTSPLPLLTSLTMRPLSTSKRTLDASAKVETQLRDAALAGCTRNFPVRDGASGYGAAVLTKDGTIYFGGQYSDPSQRLGVHAEMAVLISALADGAKEITHLGIVSSKFKDIPCSPCGSCRQFIAELGGSPMVYLFASGNETFETYSIEDLLPRQYRV